MDATKKTAAQHDPKVVLRGGFNFGAHDSGFRPALAGRRP